MCQTTELMLPLDTVLLVTSLADGMGVLGRDDAEALLSGMMTEAAEAHLAFGSKPSALRRIVWSAAHEARRLIQLADEPFE